MREKERESVCVCMCVRESVCVCVSGVGGHRKRRRALHAQGVGVARRLMCAEETKVWGGQKDPPKAWTFSEGEVDTSLGSALAAPATRSQKLTKPFEPFLTGQTSTPDLLLGPTQTGEYMRRDARGHWEHG